MSIPDAIIAAITAAVDPAKAYDGLVAEQPPERYVVVYPDAGTLAALAVCAVSDAVVHRWTVHSVAPDRAMAMWLSTAVRDALVDSRPVVDGWFCGLIRHTYSQPPVREETVMARPVINVMDTYRLDANRVA